METQVADVIEGAVMSIQGIKDVSSSSKRGGCNVTIEFELGRDIDVAMQEVQAICKAIKQSQWRLALHGIAVGYKVPHRRIGRCYWPYKSLHISAEGLVTPCCTRIRPNHALFDLLATDNIEKVWNGPVYQSLRQAHAQRDTLHHLCGDCPL